MGFEKKIRKLKRRADHPYLRKFLNCAASIVLAMFIAGSLWLSVDVEARAAFIQWVREVHEESILYRYFNMPQDDVLPTYEVTDLPEGYVRTELLVDETSCIQIFEHETDMMIFVYNFINSETQTEIEFFGDYELYQVSVGTFTADYYATRSPDETSELLWIDEENGIAFQLSSYLGKSEMLEVANSIARKE